jgi:hypothetical protein
LKAKWEVVLGLMVGFVLDFGKQVVVWLAGVLGELLNHCGLQWWGCGVLVQQQMWLKFGYLAGKI